MDIAEIKSQLSLEAVLSHYCLKPDRNNRLLCPFHQDKTPSLQVYPATNTWTCFSSNCSAGSGDTVEFIQRMDKLSKHDALLKATELAGTNSVPAMIVKAAETLTGTNLPETFEKLKISLNKSAKALSYLRERGLETAECGYNTGKEMEGMKHCIVFPLKNREENIVSLYGRSILNNDTAKHYYSVQRQGLYPGYPSIDIRTLILTEAIIDAASLMQWTMDNGQLTMEILACYGTNGLTLEHLEAIKSLESIEEIIFFFDGDQAGEKAVEKHSLALHELLPEIKISCVATPEGEDINSLWVNYGGESLSQLLSERDFLFSTEENSIERKETISKALPGAAEAEGTLNTTNPELITYRSGILEFLLLGGLNLQQTDRLKVTVKVSRTDSRDPLHSIRHSLDLYHADYLERFIAKASEQLETGTALLRRALAELTEALEKYRFSRIESLKVKRPVAREVSEERRAKAVAYLKAPDLLSRTSTDIGRTGLVGEETNRLLMYLVFTSRLREQPLHIISLGSSASGKTYLQEKVSELIPESDKLEITILSENAFYYFGQKELKHKLVLIEDLDGAMEVLYPLRELQTKRKISKTIPVKDAKGNLKTVTLQVEGPISLAGTTTKERLYEDNANRSLLIYLDNTPEHREAVMDYQRRVSAGKIDTRKENYLKEFFKDMQAVLKPVKVRNPYAEYLKLPESVFKPLRTHSHYLQFIELVTFYHQYQRELKSQGYGLPYIETTIGDIEASNELLKDILLSKSDELPKALRDFFEGLKYYLKSTERENFYARDIRSRLRMNPMTINRYIHELESRGYVKRSGGNRKSGYEYTVGQWHEYDKLQSSMQLLAQIVEELKCNKYNNAVQSGGVILQSSETLVR